MGSVYWICVEVVLGHRNESVGVKNFGNNCRQFISRYSNKARGSANGPCHDFAHEKAAPKRLVALQNCKAPFTEEKDSKQQYRGSQFQV